jgi:hypothetical protein
MLKARERQFKQFNPDLKCCPCMCGKKYSVEAWESESIEIGNGSSFNVFHGKPGDGTTLFSGVKTDLGEFLMRAQTTIGAINCTKVFDHEVIEGQNNELRTVWYDVKQTSLSYRATVGLLPVLVFKDGTLFLPGRGNINNLPAIPSNLEEITESGDGFSYSGKFTGHYHEESESPQKFFQVAEGGGIPRLEISPGTFRDINDLRSIEPGALEDEPFSFFFDEDGLFGKEFQIEDSLLSVDIEPKVIGKCARIDWYLASFFEFSWGWTNNLVGIATYLPPVPNNPCNYDGRQIGIVPINSILGDDVAEVNVIGYYASSCRIDIFQPLNVFQFGADRGLNWTDRFIKTVPTDPIPVEFPSAATSAPSDNFSGVRVTINYEANKKELTPDDKNYEEFHECVNQIENQIENEE